LDAVAAITGATAIPLEVILAFRGLRLLLAPSTWKSDARGILRFDVAFEDGITPTAVATPRTKRIKRVYRRIDHILSDELYIHARRCDRFGMDSRPSQLHCSPHILIF
jgi:hypothetical protein